MKVYSRTFANIGLGIKAFQSKANGCVIILKGKRNWVFSFAGAFSHEPICYETDMTMGMTNPLPQAVSVGNPTLVSFMAIPENMAKEWISISYVQAIAAQVGLNINDVRWDDGVDLNIGSTKPVVQGFTMRNLWVSLQLKATEHWEVADGFIKFFLKQSNYDQLRAPSITRQYLVLYTLPCNKGRPWWIQQQPEHVDFASRAFFLDLLNAAELTPRKNGRKRTGKTVQIPITNRLTAHSLHKLYSEAAEWTRRKLMP